MRQKDQKLQHVCAFLFVCRSEKRRTSEQDRAGTVALKLYACQPFSRYDSSINLLFFS